MALNRLTAVLLVVIGVHLATANILTNALFGSDQDGAGKNANGTQMANSTVLNANATNATLEDMFPHGKVHILIQRIFLIPVDDAEEGLIDDSSEDDSEEIPDVEFHKLKSSAQQAGLSDEKSNRLVRAVKLSNVSYSELTELRTLLSNASTSANYADKARVALEENYKQHVVVRSQMPGHEEVMLPTSQSVDKTAQSPIVTIEGEPSNQLPPLPAIIDGVTMKRLMVSAELAGLTPAQMQNLAQSIYRANLNGTQVAELEKAIVTHAPSADDLNKLAEILGWKSADLAGAMKSSLFKPSGVPLTAEGFNRTARALGEGVSSLYSWPRLCGYRVATSDKWANGDVAAPNEYPWSAAVYSSNDQFLCAATLVSGSMVLTTGSCILKYRKNNQPLKVLLGAYDLPHGQDQSNWLPRLEVFARSAVVHSSYQEGSTDMRNNIGLIRLSEAVNFDLYPHIFPICVIEESIVQQITTDQSRCTLTGWPGASYNPPRMPRVLSSSQVNPLVTSCPASSSSCVSGPACIANEGSPVLCPGSTANRFYLRSIAALAPNCEPRSTSVVATVSVLENFEFLMKYLTVSSS